MAWWCVVVDKACGAAGVVREFFWGASVGMHFHQFLLDLRSFLPTLSHIKALHYLRNPWVVWVYTCGDPWLKS